MDKCISTQDSNDFSSDESLNFSGDEPFFKCYIRVPMVVVAMMMVAMVVMTMVVVMMVSSCISHSSFPFKTCVVLNVLNILSVLNVLT